MSLHFSRLAKKSKTVSVLLLITCLQISSLILPVELDSANLTLTKDTLQSGRLSFSGRVKSPTAASTSDVWIYTVAAANFRSINTGNLHIGDLLNIGTGTYTVKGITDVDQFSVSPVLAAGDAADGAAIYLKQSPQHVITFTTTTAVPNGWFQVLIPAAAANQNDGKPDETGFDFNSMLGSYLSATNISGYTFAASPVMAATVSGGAGCTSPANYHCFEFHYSGTGGIGSGITLNIGNGTNDMLAPQPSSTHTQGTADTYTYIVRQYDATGTLIDSTTGKMAVIEAVRVTATVDPTISFALAGVTGATSTCGSTNDIDTSSNPLSIPFGSLPLNTFRKASTRMSVSTNANYGYAVTVIENDALSKNGVPSSVGPSIADTACDSGPCTPTSSREWNTSTNNGFGYAVDKGTAAMVSGTYAGYNELARTFSAKPFPATASASPETVMSSTTVANNEQAYVCYRISVSGIQPAGDYENLITYTATASF